MVENRRESVRRVRRVQVRFWLRGSEAAQSGYTNDISATGMFVITASPLPKGSRLRIEVVDARHGFVVEAIVAHSHRVHREMLATGRSGMGVRFVAIEDLVKELFPEVDSAPVTPAPAEVAHEVSVPVTREPEPKPVRTQSPPAGGSFVLRFPTLERFQETYERDLKQGGLFLSTERPASLGDQIEIDLHLPAPLVGVVRLRARVVHRIEPRPAAAEHGSNLLAGLGVELLDPRGALDALEPFLRPLRLRDAR